MLYKISHRIFILLVLTIIFYLRIETVVWGIDIPEKKLWFKYAVEYINADERMIINATQGKQTFVQDYNKRYLAEKKLLNSKGPTEKELMDLLLSSNKLYKKVAIVNVMLRRLYSHSLYKLLFEVYERENDFWIKTYIIECFKSLDDRTILDYEDRMLDLISKEKSPIIIMNAMSVLIKLTPDKIIPLFVKFLKSNDKGLKRFSFVYLKKMGDKYLEEVKMKLKQEGAIDALKFIEEAEKRKKPE